MNISKEKESSSSVIVNYMYCLDSLAGCVDIQLDIILNMSFSGPQWDSYLLYRYQVLTHCITGALRF